MDPEQLSREFLRALRGKRSQVGFSRRLGFSTNVAYGWESGRRSPSMTEVFRACRLVGIDPVRAVQAFFAPLDWLADADLEQAESVARLVVEVRGDIAVGELAERTGVSRFALSRWQSGRSTPRIHEFFALVHAASNRLPDFVAGFVDPTSLPSLAEHWHTLESRRRLAWEHPWASAILQGLQLEDYSAHPCHRPGWLADALGLTWDIENTCIEVLEDAGAIQWTGSHYARAASLTVDTRRSPDAGRLVQAHWARAGLDRIESGAPGLFGYNVFSVSSEDLAQLRQMHRAHYQAMRAVISRSKGADHVVVANLQLFELGPHCPEN